MKPINAPTDSGAAVWRMRVVDEIFLFSRPSLLCVVCFSLVCFVFVFLSGPCVLRCILFRPPFFGSVLSPRERPTSGRTVSGVTLRCAQARRADWGPKIEGALCVTPGPPGPWLRAATVPLCISCVRSSPVGAVTSPQPTIHDTSPIMRREAPLVVRGPKVTRRAPRTKLGSEICGEVFSRFMLIFMNAAP